LKFEHKVKDLRSIFVWTRLSRGRKERGRKRKKKKKNLLREGERKKNKDNVKKIP
jgi:hypothetical protein